MVYSISDASPTKFVHMMTLSDLDLYGKVNFALNAFIWENTKILDFIETIEVYELKVGTVNCQSEYMNI